MTSSGRSLYFDSSTEPRQRLSWTSSAASSRKEGSAGKGPDPRVPEPGRVGADGGQAGSIFPKLGSPGTPAEGASKAQAHTLPVPSGARAGKVQTRGRRRSWADLLRRVLGIEALRCSCGASMRAGSDHRPCDRPAHPRVPEPSGAGAADGHRAVVQNRAVSPGPPTAPRSTSIRRRPKTGATRSRPRRPLERQRVARELALRKGAPWPRGPRGHLRPPDSQRPRDRQGAWNRPVAWGPPA